MREAKASTGKATHVENPAWLWSEPAGPGPKPPVVTRDADLPILELGWENFERLCCRLARSAGEVEKVWAYGTQGHKQLGIDVLVRMKDGTFETWQSKRHKTFGPNQLKIAIAHFLNGAWAKQARRFVLAVACEAASPKIIDAIERARTDLKLRGIVFEPVFAKEISERLKEKPDIIDDFFGRPWAELICAPELVSKLADRMSRIDIAALRMRVRSLYTAWIGIVDPGLPLVGHIGVAIPSPDLTKRYVVPEVILPAGFTGADDRRAEVQPNVQAARAGNGVEDPASATAQGQKEPPKLAHLHPTERRTSINQLLSETTRAVVSADAGAGKTTLLRYLALQLLADRSDMEAVNERFAGHVPVWVPFALWARMAEGKDRPPPLEDVVHSFIEALNEPDVAVTMRRALKIAKVVLLVDGLDEARDQAIADALLVSLSVFAERTGVPVFATSRPHGTRALSGIGGTWTRARLAPLSDRQRADLALLWYRILERQELGAGADDAAVERHATSRAGAFSKALLHSPGIAGLSRTPLFLLALLKLHRLGRDLPHNRFEANKEIVEQLVEHQPKRRAKDAMRLDQGGHGLRQRDRILEDFAFGLHAGELQGSVADGAFEKDAIARAASLIMVRAGSANRDQAEEQAQAIFVFGEEVAGLLVKKASNSVGFLHRSLQEYFAGAYLSQLSLPERLTFIRDHVAQSVWKEPILYLLFLTRNEQEVGNLLRAIDEADAGSVVGKAARDRLLIEATFADFAHDLPTVRSLADRLFGETELCASGARQQALVAGVVDGLFSQSVSTQCAKKLGEWIPDYHGWARHAAVLAVAKWDRAMRPTCIPVLMRIVAGDHEHVARAAGHVLADFGEGKPDVKQTLLRMFREPRSIETMRAVFVALGRGWSKDADVATLALQLRAASPAGMQIDALRVRAARGDAGLDDLKIFAELAYRGDRFSSDTYARDLVGYFAARHKGQLIAYIEEALAGKDRRRVEIPLLGALVMADPSHRLVVPLLRGILAEDWSVSELFARSQIPLDRIAWTPELVCMVKEKARHDDHHDYDWYWISKVLRFDSLKAKMIESVKSGKGLTFWSSNGLAEFWGKDDPDVVAAFRELLRGPSSAIAEAAENLPTIVDDLSLVRPAILRALSDKPRDTRFLLRALRRLRLSKDDEAFRVALAAGDPARRSLYDDGWREEMIRTFGDRPEIREMARTELLIRDGAIGAVAETFAADSEMCTRVLNVLAPLPETARLGAIALLGAAAPSNAAAFTVLASARHDTDGATAGEAVMAWTEVCAAQGPVGKAEIEFLGGELDAIGPQYQHRRAAAVAGLAVANRLDIFVTCGNEAGKARDVDIGYLTALDTSDRYINRILPRWDAVAAMLGGEEAALARFQLTPETTLPILDPGTPNAQRIFDLLGAGKDARAALDIRLAALRRFAPEGQVMRELVERLLRSGSSIARAHLSRKERWPAWMAAEIFAEHFAESDLRRVAVDQLTADPGSDCAAAALAETFLRDGDAALKALLAEKTQGREYDLATAFRLIAAVGDIVGALERLLEKDPNDVRDLNCAYWVPAVLRRIERDDGVAEALIKAVGNAPSASARLSELALLGRGCTNKAQIQPTLERALRAFEAAEIPVVAFDVTTESFRLASQALRELLS